MDNTSINSNFDLNKNANENTLSFFERVFGILYEPKEVFEDLNKKPRILFPILLISLGVITYLLIRYSLFSEYTKEILLRTFEQQNQAIPKEQMNMFLKYSGIFTLVMTPISSIIGWLIFSGSIFGFVKIFKGDGTFKKYLSITGYAYVIIQLHILISFILSYPTGELYTDASLGILVSEMKGTYIYGIIKSLDFFSIWHYGVVAIGVKLLSNLDTNKVAIIIGTIFLITRLLAASSLMYL